MAGPTVSATHASIVLHGMDLNLDTRASMRKYFNCCALRSSDVRLCGLDFKTLCICFNVCKADPALGKVICMEFAMTPEVGRT